MVGTTLGLKVTTSATIQITETEAMNFHQNLMTNGSVTFGNPDNFSFTFKLDQKLTNIKEEASSLMTEVTNSTQHNNSGADETADSSYVLERVSEIIYLMTSKN